MGLLFTKIWSLFGNEGWLLLLVTHLLKLNLIKASLTHSLMVLFSEHKIVIVGLDNAGKTTILYQFLMNEVVHTSPTIGSNVEEVVWKNIHFMMWDLGGQQSLRAAWSTYYSNTEVFAYVYHDFWVNGQNGFLLNCVLLFQFVIVVIDSTDRERLTVTREELYRMLSHEDLSKAAVLIFANKQDLKGSMTAAEISKQLDLTSIKKQQWHIQSCCALTGEGWVLLYVKLEPKWWIA